MAGDGTEQGSTMMVPFLVGLGTGLVVGFVIGAVWMAASTVRWNARMRDRWSHHGTLWTEDDEEDR